MCPIPGRLGHATFSLPFRVVHRLVISNTDLLIVMIHFYPMGRPADCRADMFLVNDRCGVRVQYAPAGPQRKMKQGFPVRHLVQTGAMQICDCPRIRIFESVEM